MSIVRVHRCFLLIIGSLFLMHEADARLPDKNRENLAWCTEKARIFFDAYLLVRLIIKENLNQGFSSGFFIGLNNLSSVALDSEVPAEVQEVIDDFASLRALDQPNGLLQALVDRRREVGEQLKELKILKRSLPNSSSLSLSASFLEWLSVEGFFLSHCLCQMNLIINEIFELNQAMIKFQRGFYEKKKRTPQESKELFNRSGANLHSKIKQFTSYFSNPLELPDEETASVVFDL